LHPLVVACCKDGFSTLDSVYSHSTYYTWFSEMSICDFFAKYDEIP
jgi:hypothetical protein